MSFKKTAGYQVVSSWLSLNNRQPFLFQEQTWEQIHLRHSGLVNAPTGYGKTFAVFLGAVIQFINEYPDDYANKKNNGLRLLWITPLRALGKDIARAMEEAIHALGLAWEVGIRNGDTSTSERGKQKRRMPEVLVITPESLHLLLAQKGYPLLFANLEIIAVDEWHELLGSKRGVLVELAVSRLVNLKNTKVNGQWSLGGKDIGHWSIKDKVIGHWSLGVRDIGHWSIKEKVIGHWSLGGSRIGASVWGISATIGNMEEAKDVLLHSLGKTGSIISAQIKKKTEVKTILPDEIEKYPWAGHLGLKLADKVLPIIDIYKTTLIFINTRGMSERWYQELLNISPDLSGTIALHHGSIEQELRVWVEEALHKATLKAVVCTSSLDLGVDFRPVESVIQVGSPKGVARFLQRAGRSGHQPGAISNIHFLPTHSLELLEVAALKEAIADSFIESRQPFMLCYDVLLQYMCTLAISEGFKPDELFKEISATHCFKEISKEDWQQLLHFITAGGVALQQYDDFKKVEVIDDMYKITNRRIAMRHRMHIGTIVSDAMLKIKFISGGFIGVVEEWFISRLNPGDVFTLGGRNLEFVMIKDMTALVKKTNAKKSIVPSWMGGRMALSTNLGFMLRKKLDDAGRFPSATTDPELLALQPLLHLQQKLSHVPLAHELLIEHIETKDGFHLFVYPFEGRLVHEAMAALLAFRISRITPITFSIAMNDYGFELLSDQPIPVDDSNVYELFSEENLLMDIQQSVNATEMAKRKFRDIAVIGGLIFQGMPGEQVKQKHLQSSASLLFKVFTEYEPGNLLIRQAYQEVMEQQMDEPRLRQMLQRISTSTIIFRFPTALTPFCFPIKVDSIRENMSSENLEDRVKRMQEHL